MAELGRGLKPERRRGRPSRRRRSAERVEMAIDDRIGREDGRFDLQKAPALEELPQPAEQLRPQPQPLPNWRPGGSRGDVRCDLSAVGFGLGS